MGRVHKCACGRDLYRDSLYTGGQGYNTWMFCSSHKEGHDAYKFTGNGSWRQVGFYAKRRELVTA